MPTALDRRVAYYGIHLSENIARTPDDFLICKNAVIGRTGFQTYRVAEIYDPGGLLAEQGYSPDDSIEVWRDPKEVFSAATIASFEGKPFTLTHPDQLLDPDNVHRHAMGHVQNIRRGDEALSNGDWPMLADVIVTSREAIDAIERGERELSCGYTYRLVQEGRRFDQREILGNHVALVQRGRAGSEARINDAAPEIEVAPKETPVRIQNPLKHIIALGMQMFAKDAKPEDLTEVLENKEIAVAMGSAPARAAATDSADNKSNVITLVDPAAAAVNQDGKKFISLGKTSDGVEIFKAVAADNAVVTDEEKRSNAERRKVVHRRLDLILDAAEKNRGSATDADLKQLEKDLNKFLALDGEEKEEATDDEHPKGCRCDDCMDKRKGKDDTETEREVAAEDDEEEKKGEDDEEEEEGEDAEIIRGEPVLTGAEIPKNALGRDADALRLVIASANLESLKMLKPFVARSNDKKLKAAFDQMVKTYKKVLKGDKNGTGSYADFTRASATLSAEARDSRGGSGGGDWKPKETEAQKRQREADALYADVMKKSTDSMRAAAMGGRTI